MVYVVLLLVAIATWLVFFSRGRSSYEMAKHQFFKVKAGINIAAIILMGVLVSLSFLHTAILHHHDQNIKNSGFLLAEVESQRDLLLSEFDEILSNDDFVQLMNAAVPEDVLFLRQRPEITGFLLGRADRIVELNARYFTLRNELLTQAKGLCNTVRNPFALRLPLLSPDCRLAELSNLVINESNVAQD